jgi:hypothetical protein
MNKENYSYHSMKANLKWFALFLLLWCIYQALWIWQVNPMPDRDAFAQIYQPGLAVMNLLVNGVSFKPDAVVELFPDTYPYGPVVLLFLLYALGLGKAFLAYPWIWDLYILIPLCLSISIIPVKRRIQCLIFLLFAFHPSTRIFLFNFSGQSIGNAWFILTITLLLFYAPQKFRSWSFLFLIVTTLVTAFSKHLGMLQILTLLISIGALKGISVLKKPPTWGLILGALSASFFYRFDRVNEYYDCTVQHNQSLTNYHIFMLVTAVILCALLLIYIKRNFNKKTDLSRAWQITGAILINIIPWIIVISDDGPSGLIHLAGLVFIFTTGIFAIRRFFQWDNPLHVMLWTSIFLLCISSLLFLSGFGKVFAGFGPPMLLCGTLLVITLRMKSLPIIIGFAILSNFGPSIDTLEPLPTGRGTNVYNLAFNTIHLNPLSWKPCRLSSMREKIIHLLQQYLPFDKDHYEFIKFHMYSHPYTDFLLRMTINHVPPLPIISTMDLHPVDDEKFVFDLHHKLSESTYEQSIDLIKQGAIAAVIRVDKGFSMYSRYCATDFSSPAFKPEHVNNVRLLYDLFEHSDVLDTHFHKFDLSEGKIKAWLYIYNYNQPPRDKSKEIQSFLLEYSRPKDAPSNNLIQAARIFAEGSQYFNEKNFFITALMLGEALKLNPDDPNIREDLNIASNELTDEDLEILLRCDMKPEVKRLMNKETVTKEDIKERCNMLAE